MNGTGTDRTCVVLQSGADPLMTQMAELLTTVWRDVQPAVLVRDGDRAIAAASRVVLIGDILRLARSGALLSRLASRPKTVLWQLEPIVPGAAFERAMSETRSEPIRDRVMWGLDYAGTRFLRPLVPHGVRNRLRETVKNVVSSPVPSTRSRAAWGYHHIERVRRLMSAHADGWLDAIAVSAPERVRTLDYLGIQASFVPVGYHPDLVGDHSITREIDALFLGRIKGARADTLSWLEHEIARRGKRLVVSEGPLFGVERTALLNRSKTCLNLSGPDGEFPRIRAVLGIAAGALVLSDPVEDTRPLLDGVHIVCAPIDRWPQLVADYCSEELRRPLIQAAQRFLREEWTMNHAGDRLRELI